jgi:hypothetical protein
MPLRVGRDDRDDRESRDDRENISNGHLMPPVPTRPAARDQYQDYEFSDLDEITVRQLNEDILAYRYDLDYCQAQLEEADLNPQETRTLQLRTLDLGHQLRHCAHRIETIKAQTRKQSFRPRYGTMATVAYPVNGANGSARQARAVSGGGYGVGVPLPGKRIAATAASSAFAVGGKRPALDEEQGSAKRAKMASPDFDMTGGGLDEGVNTALQRLGFWKCRLCSAPKYLLAGAGRSPAAPCKWPLKDISKMITHFTEMHSEHSPPERCTELGAALAQNREYPPRGVKSRFSLCTPELANMWILGGPFEYWLRRTRAQNISDPSVIDDCFDTLLNGEMPDLLRRHSRAAAGMPAY